MHLFASSPLWHACQNFHCSQCWYRNESIACTTTSIFIGVCLEGDSRQWFTFQTLGTTYNADENHPEVLIKTMRGWCLHRYESAVYTNPHCDPNDMHQRFFAVSGSFTGDRFEIGQYQGYTQDNCLTVRTLLKFVVDTGLACMLTTPYALPHYFKEWPPPQEWRINPVSRMWIRQRKGCSNKLLGGLLTEFQLIRPTQIIPYTSGEPHGPTTQVREKKDINQAWVCGKLHPISTIQTQTKTCWALWPTHCCTRVVPQLHDLCPDKQVEFAFNIQIFSTPQHQSTINESVGVAVYKLLYLQIFFVWCVVYPSKGAF